MKALHRLFDSVLRALSGCFCRAAVSAPLSHRYDWLASPSPPETGGQAHALGGDVIFLVAPWGVGRLDVGIFVLLNLISSVN